MLRTPIWIGILALSGALAACDESVPPTDEHLPEEDASLLRFDVDGEGFYRMPWPHDLRRTAEGNVDLRDFPGSRRNAILQSYLQTVNQDVYGFATMPVLYVPADAPLSSVGLPTPAESLEENALVQLVDLSTESCGKRVPIRVRADGVHDIYETPYRFTVEVVGGAALHPARPYALLLREGLEDASGELLKPNEAFKRALRDEDQNTPLGRVHAPLLRCLPFAPDDESLLLATVFTTQDPVEELLRLRETVRNPDAVPLHPLEAFERSSLYSTSVREVYVGEFQAPIFLRGETPYTDSGGGFVFDALGAPVVQRWENVPFTLSFPSTGEGPFPVLVWVDGTGATLGSPIGDGWYRRALEEGFAVASPIAPFHDSRAVPGSDEVMSSFNYMNPEAGRSIFRQQATEISYFLRVLGEGMVDELSDIGRSLDTQNIHYGGHSQGGLVGSMALAVEPDFRSAVLNGTGGWLAVTIIERKDVMNIAGLVSLIFKTRSSLDKSHPVIQVAQMAAEVVDPQSYVRRWAGSPEDPDGLHVLVINGDEDPTTHVDSVNHLLLTADLPVLEPAGWDPDPHGVFEVRSASMPVEANTETPAGHSVLHATWLEPSGGHFTMYYSSFARELAVQLWTSARDGAPRLSSGAAP